MTYVAHLLTNDDQHTGRCAWAGFRDCFWPNTAIKYFDMELLCSEELKLRSSERYIFGIHPHGIFTYGGLLLYASESPLRKRFKSFMAHPCVASVTFYVPIIREYLLWTGHIDASRRTVDKALAEGKNIGIVIGGEAEVLQTENSKEKVVLLGRKGFVKMALKHKASLVPTYAFGQNDTFTIDKKSGFWIRNWLQRKFKISIPVFWGRMGGPVPHRKKIYVAVANPVKMPAKVELDENGDPDPRVVDEYHRKYVFALQELFESYKSQAGYKDRVLEVLHALHAAVNIIILTQRSNMNDDANK
eukprot:CAMPEP_0197522360 /NCGR_PEP_ID=MMETSP1318-20131121/7526_1 /TAXON_ID=552666 /ORGANISM="Partenskyella glossopodia, Strain RCC365" /LENGTH=301 /DNA_ID=CAMNT_0043074725 /DNA_START=162 /DNA_END=1068 /DNA_ORIENTATION=-